MRHLSLVPALSATLLLGAAAGVAAQSCLGLPTRDGQITVAGNGGRIDDETQYGVEVTADVTGPAAFAFGYGGLGTEGDRQVITGRASFDFFLLEPAVCGVAGVLFDDAPLPGIEERLGIPVGIGIGKTLRGESFSTTVFAVPQYVWLREKRTVALPTDGIEEETVTSNEFMAEAGVTLGFQPFYVGGSLLVDTFEGSEPGFRIRAGLMF